MSGEFRLDPLPGEDLENTVEIPVSATPVASAEAALDKTAVLTDITLDDLPTEDPPRHIETNPILGEAVGSDEVSSDLREAEERVARREDRLAIAELAVKGAREAAAKQREAHAQELVALQEVARGELEQERARSRLALQRAEAALQAAMQSGAGDAEQLRRLKEQAAQATARAEDLALRLAQQRTELEAERSSARALREHQHKQDSPHGALHRELEELRSISARRLESLRSLEGYRAVSDAQLDARERHIVELETQLLLLQATQERREREHVQLAQDLKDAQQALSQERAQRLSVDGARQELAATVTLLQGKLSNAQWNAAAELALRDQRHTKAKTELQEGFDRQHAEQQANFDKRLAEQQQDFQRQHAAQQEAFDALQVERSSLSEHVVAREHDLRAAEEHLGRVEADVSQRVSRVEELTRGNELLSQRLADARRDLEARELRIRDLESQALTYVNRLADLHQNIKRLGREVPPRAPLVTEGAPPAGVRELLLELDGQVKRYALGRRITIGRTPDNDIVLDTGFISRNHAVFLSSSKHTIVEDLNSTNGIRVNGLKVTRHVLTDGDVVTIGKTDFRFRAGPEVDADAAHLP